MQPILTSCFVIIVMNFAVYILFQEGMLLSWFRIGTANLLDRAVGMRVAKIVQQPLWDCFTCMSSFWSILWMLIFPNLRPDLLMYALEIVLIVCGIAAVIDRLFLEETE
jgi:hypothetical protein